MFSILSQDLARAFPSARGLKRCLLAVFDVAIWAIAVFRFGKWLQRLRFRPLRLLGMGVYFILYRSCEIVSGIRISSDSEIGPGLRIVNFGGIIVHGNLGCNCTLEQGAQLISQSNGRSQGWPTLGDNVFVGSGAKLLGSVKVGRGARIEANAVVLSDVPEGATVLPPESRIMFGSGQALPVAPVRASSAPAGTASQLVRTILQLPSDFSIPDSVPFEDLPNWDSLAFVHLVTAIESRLQRRLDLYETASLISLASVETLIASQASPEPRTVYEP